MSELPATTAAPTTEIVWQPRPVSLEDLAYEIFEETKQCEQYKREAMTAAELAMDRAKRIGDHLLRAQRLIKKAKGEVKFVSWFDSKIRDQCQISLATAYRYMAFAQNFSLVRKSLKQSYVKIGLLPEPKPKPQATGTAPVDIIECAFNGAVKYKNSLSAFLEDAQPYTWPEEKRAALKAELQPLVEVYQRL